MSWIMGMFANAIYALAIIAAALWLGGWLRTRIEELPSRQERFDPMLAASWAVRHAMRSLPSR